MTKLCRVSFFCGQPFFFTKARPHQPTSHPNSRHTSCNSHRKSSVRYKHEWLLSRTKCLWMDLKIERKETPLALSSFFPEAIYIRHYGLLGNQVDTSITYNGPGFCIVTSRLSSTVWLTRFEAFC